MTQNVSAFLAERKAAWLKTRLKPSLSADEETAFMQEADDKFDPASWLPDAARRATWLAMVSHPGKFSHPSAKTTAIIADRSRANDGYLRSGNVDYELDVLGNAAAMDVYKFLRLTMDDGQTVLQHLEKDSPEIQRLFQIPTAAYTDLKSGFLSVKSADGHARTDHLVKQVYFPVDENYHLLSVLTPSGLVSRVKERIDAMRFSEHSKQARESRKKNEHHPDGFDDLFNLTVMAYGGTKPQNISVLNNQNAGRAYLLASTPPILKRRQVRLPARNFFKNSLSPRAFADSFQTLDRLIRSDVNNKAVRDGIRNTVKFIIDQVLQRVFKIRESGLGWSEPEYYRALPLAQRIWLDDAYLAERGEQEAWLDEVCADFSRWILDSYDKVLKDKHQPLGDDELREIRHIVEEAAAADKEFFK